MKTAAIWVVLVLAYGKAEARPEVTCDRAVETWKRLDRALLLDAIGQPNADDRARIAKQIESGAKELGAACKKFGWPAEYKRCLAEGKKPEALERCFHAEYERGKNREICESLLDHYIELADADFKATLYDGHDAEWIESFRDTHRASYRPWCIERGLTSDTGAACARAAKTRDAFLACGAVP